ncbi:aminodeoxychorismate synthase component I [Pelagicoccus mobilis]|uniref:aminodeoxychorismate synthase n=1 Tax=Pelagicoccus mobilis TaxID=415221 RepID=A0A934S252_9BACT|nr:aminodeoxychorismate synthase component I [Pelagicoccus mobilis]MBK1879241.1 aminodeoxychorismate synthase component I [Pelagicoccus mobilis]
MFERKLEVPFEPLAAAKRLEGSPGLAFLYSGLQAYGLGRYSILAANPKEQIALFGEKSDCFGELQKAYPEFGKQSGGDLPFYSGLIGYFSYDAGRQLERAKFGFRSTEKPLGRFGYYQGGIVFDHSTEETWLVAESEAASAAVEPIVEQAFGATGSLSGDFELCSELRSNFEKEEYCERVESIRSLISQGEVYQVNLSQRFEAQFRGSGLELFFRLAEYSPAPYSAYLSFGDEEIVSSSPERFLYVDGEGATTRPIKGTRATGGSEIEAGRNEEELRGSEKDRSELLMIVDLERNDLGRVCEPGSVRVDELFRLERYATVIHQTADVSGTLENGVDAMACAKAMFPGGSITGAPKIRAMQVIDDLERGERGVYTGSIGYFDMSGRADLNIAIRTLRLAGNTLSYQVGGGVVWDSDPESEYEETLLKAKAMVKALHGGNDE